MENKFVDMAFDDLETGDVLSRDDLLKFFERSLSLSEEDAHDAADVYIDTIENFRRTVKKFDKKRDVQSLLLLVKRVEIETIKHTNDKFRNDEELIYDFDVGEDGDVEDAYVALDELLDELDYDEFIKSIHLYIRGDSRHYYNVDLSTLPQKYQNAVEKDEDEDDKLLENKRRRYKNAQLARNRKIKESFNEKAFINEVKDLLSLAKDIFKESDNIDYANLADELNEWLNVAKSHGINDSAVYDLDSIAAYYEISDASDIASSLEELVGKLKASRA